MIFPPPVYCLLTLYPIYVIKVKCNMINIMLAHYITGTGGHKTAERN